MATSRKVPSQPAGFEPITPLLPRAAPRHRLIAHLFVRESVDESVTTRVHFRATPKDVWRRILFYEEIPGHAPLLLRLFLPRPLRTEGDKTQAGNRVRCVYRGGDLTKRILAVEPPSRLEFEVIGQNLGIERFVQTCGGSYRITSCREGADVTLVTHYRAGLHPRWLWQGLEALLVGQLHRHILAGVRAALLPAGSPARSVFSFGRRLRRGSPGGLACTASPSASRR